MFTQHAHGSFSVTIKGDFHCGPGSDSPKSFEWAATLSFPDSALNEHGFLLDNTVYGKYFRELRETADSCELLVLKAAKHFHRSAPYATKVEVSVTVPGLATVTNIQPEGAL